MLGGFHDHRCEYQAAYHAGRLECGRIPLRSTKSEDFRAFLARLVHTERVTWQ